MADVIVVGSGVAGLTAALTANAAGCRVTLVTKSGLLESNSYFAQGGVASAMWEDDSVPAHVADTLRAGAGLGDPEAVRALCAEGPERIQALIELGVAFDRTDGVLSRGLEAAHSHARVLHAGGDATGAAIETTLARTIDESHIEVREHTFVTDLIADDGAVHGITVLDRDDAVCRIEADAVILASGGAGQLFQHTTNPLVATGDGIAAAWRAGARLADLEFFQFHPTALALGTAGTRSFLVSEAVRGEGAILINEAGRRFMRSVHPDAELAPRDVVARGIAVEMAAQEGVPVRLDATGLGRDFLATRFPTIDAACRAAGVDWSAEPIPVTPAAHYWMGGIATDSVGQTSLPGLYAVGEAACTGAHGANRLASNSLLEALVFAHRAAVDIAHGGGDERAPRIVGDDLVEVPLDSVRAGGIERPVVDRGRLQTLLWGAAGLHRNGPALESASDELRSLGCARDPYAGRSRLEDANLLDLARVLVAAAIAREESRGAHFRTDYPTPTSNGARHRAWAGKVIVPC